MRILVVDDDTVFREELSLFLSDEGHETATAPSVRKAIEVMESGDQDVLFTDLRMPRQNGLELLKEVRKRWPRTYVIVVTGFATVPTAVEAMKLGAFEYISKPFRGDQVRSVLKLIHEETRYSDAGLPTEDTAELARRLSEHAHQPILLLTDPVVAAGPTVVVRPFDGRDPSRLTDEVTAFLTDHPKGGLVIAHVERMLADHRVEDVVDLLRRTRDRFEGGGPVALGLDPRKVSAEAAAAVRSVLVAREVHGALEAIASPIRRRVLLRLALGTASFSDAMRAVELDDSPKLSFHLHRLVDEGLIAHVDEMYKLTPKGEGTVELLREMEKVAAGSTADAILFRPVPGTAGGRGHPNA